MSDYNLFPRRSKITVFHLMLAFCLAFMMSGGAALGWAVYNGSKFNPHQCGNQLPNISKE